MKKVLFIFIIFLVVSLGQVKAYAYDIMYMQVIKNSIVIVFTDEEIGKKCFLTLRATLTKDDMDLLLEQSAIDPKELSKKKGVLDSSEAIRILYNFPEIIREMSKKIKNIKQNMYRASLS
jgi:hypothetical protein